MMVHMVAVGERSGQLEVMLARTSPSRASATSTAKVSRPTTVLSPVLIVVIGAGRRFHRCSISSPIMDMQNFTRSEEKPS